MALKILIASNLGIYEDGRIIDSFLYDGLTYLGHDVEIALCDKLLPACQMSKIPRVSPRTLALEGQSGLCQRCFERGSRAFQARKTWKIGSLSSRSQTEIGRELESLDLTSLRQFEYRGVAVGEHGYAGAVRYFASLQLEHEEYGTDVVRRYVQAAISIVDVYSSYFTENKPDVVIAHHGIYVPQGIVVALARKFGIRVYCWIKSYRKNTILFSRGDTYHHEMQTDPARFLDFDLNHGAMQSSKNYLNDRRRGVRDEIVFNRDPTPACIDTERDFCVLLTSVFWDAQVHYSANCFGDQVDWLLTTIREFESNPELPYLIVRVHPAEVSGVVPSRDTVKQRLSAAFPDGLHRTVLVDASDRTSTYELIDNARAVFIYNTKTGIEAAAMGKVVIVGGDAWIKNFDFVISPTNETAYIECIRERVWDEFVFKRTDAIKYFYAFYFRRMLDFPELDFKKSHESLKGSNGAEQEKSIASLYYLDYAIRNEKDVFFPNEYFDVYK